MRLMSQLGVRDLHRTLTASHAASSSLSSALLPSSSGDRALFSSSGAAGGHTAQDGGSSLWQWLGGGSTTPTAAGAHAPEPASTSFALAGSESRSSGGTSTSGGHGDCTPPQATACGGPSPEAGWQDGGAQLGSAAEDLWRCSGGGSGGAGGGVGVGGMDWSALQLLHSAAEPLGDSSLRSTVLGAVQGAASGYDWLHATSGLPWWAVIPLASLALRLTLLPFSLRQSVIVRKNFEVYREAARRTDEQAAAAAARAPSLAPGAPLAALVHRNIAVLENYKQQRRAAGAPHLLWLLVNPAIQVPTFVLCNMALRSMCAQGWPGLSLEGMLWFPDLTQAAYVMSSGALPMGVAGFILPATILAAGLTSIRLGLGTAAVAGARNAELVGTTMGKVMQYLPRVLYTVTLFNTYWTVQLPHGVLLHWVSSAAFTLGLQGVLRVPAVRAVLLDMPAPSTSTSPQAAAAALQKQPSDALSEQLLLRAAEMHDADGLVVLGAQQSARQRYQEALHCFGRALELQPHHVRAHYSTGQVHTQMRDYAAAEASYRAATEFAAPGSQDRGSALYCLGASLHQQGQLEEAVAAYRSAAQAWPSVIVYMQLANALVALGGPARIEEARTVVVVALKADAAVPGAPFRRMLLQLQAQLTLPAPKV